MKKYLLIITCLLGAMNTSVAQDLNQYKYVQVPQRFEFFSDDNQFQLNALTAFLFEKYGFKVLYGDQLPEDMAPCELLKADLLKDKGLFNTKLQVTLENCKGETVFTSKMGTSREKDYKAAYHEALRDAFTSVEELEYRYSENPLKVDSPDAIVFEEEDAVEEAVVEKQSAEKAVPQVEEAVTTNQAEKAVTQVEERVIENQAEKAVPQPVEADMETKSFRNGPTIYTLRAVPSGYELFKAGEEGKFASLFKSGSGSNYIYASGTLQGSANFDAEGDLVVEYLDATSGQLVTLTYQLQD